MVAGAQSKSKLSPQPALPTHERVSVLPAVDQFTYLKPFHLASPHHHHHPKTNHAHDLDITSPSRPLIHLSSSCPYPAPLNLLSVDMVQKACMDNSTAE